MADPTTDTKGYKLLTFTGANNADGTAEFDFNLIKNKRLVIKRIGFKWYQLDNVDGYPYLKSSVNVDALKTEHAVLYTSTQKTFIPENSGANKNQAGNCTLLFTINDKPVYLNGKMDNLFLTEDNLNFFINEDVQKFSIKVTNAKMNFLDATGAIVESDNLGWVCEIGVYIV